MAFFSISLREDIEYSMPYLHSHDYYELYFHLDGQRTYFCNNEYYSLSANALLTAKPNTLHKFEGGPFSRFLIGVSADMFSSAQIEFLNMLNEKTVITLSPDKMESIKKTLFELLSLYESATKNKEMQIALHLGLLFHQINDANSGTVKAMLTLQEEVNNYAISPTILKIMDYIRKNYNKPVKLEDLCNFSNLSKTWICKSFYIANHMTVFEYKLMLQLNQAKNLLQNTKYSIEQIAEMTGFSSPNYFSMVFKKNEGIPPLRFRRQFFKKK